MTQSAESRAHRAEVKYPAAASGPKKEIWGQKFGVKLAIFGFVL